jgi:pimeloyl-ACP methyl ester carboxylesterase
MRLKWLALLVLVLPACPDTTIETNEGAVPYVEFDPTDGIIPFPNDLVRDPLTGIVNIPAPACETPASAQLRTQVLNTLDGFGTYEVGLQATMTASADPSTLTGNVFLYKRLAGTTPVPVASATPVPIAVTAAQTLRYDASNCSATPATIQALTIVPQVPLDPDSTYTVAITSSVMTSSSTSFYPSFIWALVRQSEDPVMVADGCTPTPTSNCAITGDLTPIAPGTPANDAELNGIAYLWNVHAPALAFLDTLQKTETNRSNILLAWDFTTQTTTAPLDPTVANSPAAGLDGTTPLLDVFSIATTDGAPCSAAPTGCTAFLNSAAVLDGACASLPCGSVGDVLGAVLANKNFQTSLPNAANPSAPIPGPWSDPYAPLQQGIEQLGVLAFIPSSTVPPNGWPTVVFGHGLGGSREELFAVASQLAAAGFASVAIDFQDSGSRAVATSADPTLGCAGACQIAMSTSCSAIDPCTNDTCIAAAPGVGAVSPTNTPQCYASILTTDLATTRDNIRQTVLDLQQLVKSAASCGTTQCISTNGSKLEVDPNNIVYMGISLGGIIGSTTTAVEQNFQGAVLDVAAVGLLDVLENTSTLEISCPLVNALIQAGVLTGTLWSPANPTVGLCTTSAWQSQPSYVQFSQAARWVLDPADGANFATPHGTFPGLASKRFFLMEVVNDQVVPNVATDREGALVGLMPQTADEYTGAAAPVASVALGTPSPTVNHWLRYPTLAPVAPSFFGNSFQHASLLEPVPGFCISSSTFTPTTTACGSNGDCPIGDQCDLQAGELGTVRVQTDALSFLLANH